MEQEVLHFNTFVESPKVERGNILSLTCVYCYEEVLFEIPEYRLKLGRFPLQLVSMHGDPPHRFSIEVFENHDVHIVRQDVDQGKLTSQSVQNPPIPTTPERPARGEDIPAVKVPMITTPLPEVHSFPRFASNKLMESPQRFPSNQENNEPSPRFSETVQEIPESRVIQEKDEGGIISQINILIQELPRLTREEINEKISKIAPYFKQKPSLYKVASEISNWAKDINRMDWNDTQVRALTHQLKFWMEELSSSV